MKKSIKNSGQASIEFVISLGVAVILISTIVVVSLNMGIGYLAHYANFVASRTFLTYDNGSNDPINVYNAAETAAKEIFNTFNLASFGISDGQLKFNRPENMNYYEYVGTHYLYTPPFPFGIFSDFGTGKLLTESFLGREPTMSDCRCQVQTSMGFACNGYSYSQNIDLDITLFDNGC